jgi:hypothetical protein
MSAVTETPIPTVYFTNTECGYLFNANMNYAMPSEGSRIMTLNGKSYTKNGTETVHEMGHTQTVYTKYVMNENDAEVFYFRVAYGVLTITFHFIFPSKEEDAEPISISYNVGRGYYAGFFECSSADHEVKISDSGNVVVAAKESGEAVYVVWW